MPNIASNRQGRYVQWKLLPTFLPVLRTLAANNFIPNFAAKIWTKKYTFDFEVVIEILTKDLQETVGKRLKKTHPVKTGRHSRLALNLRIFFSWSGILDSFLFSNKTEYECITIFPLWCSCNHNCIIFEMF